MANTLTTNSIAPANQQKFSVFVSSDGVKNRINQMLGGKDGTKFIASIVSAVSANPALAECDNSTILSAALLGESLQLSPSASLGQYHMVPFNDNKNDRKVAQFQIGYKGYIQLAIRSGQYRTINVIELKEGELIHHDRLTDAIETKFIEDDEVREQTPTSGYYVMFELTNGFVKSMYWSKKKMEQHALKYSQGYAADKRKGMAYTFWSKAFDEMAKKTMLRQLISKWGVMSIEIVRAFEADMGVINTDGSVSYVDNGGDTVEPSTETQEPQVSVSEDGNDILFS